MDNNNPLAAVRRRWWLVALLGAAGAAIVAVPEPASVEEQASTFVATHTMLLNDPAAAQTNQGAVSPSQIPLLATTGEVPARVADALGADENPATLASQMQVDFDFNTGALIFTTTQASAARAEELADAFADATSSYLAQRQDRLFEERLAASIQRLADLEDDLDDITRQLATRPEDAALIAQRDAISRQYSVAFEQNQMMSSAPTSLAFTTLERAQAVEQIDRGLAAPRSRNVRGAMGLIVGLAVGAALAVLLGRVDRRIRTREQAEAIIGTRARVTIPKVRDPRRDKLIVTSGRHDPLSDAYRTVRNVVGFVQGSLEPVDRAFVTVVVSPGPGDGKTSLATNLAAAFVETGNRTIAVNTDFRRPRLSKAISDDRSSDLPFTYEDLEVLAPKSLLVRSENPSLLVMDLSSIDGSAGDLVRATATTMPTLAEMSDQIVVDTSPVGATAEVLEMVPFADVILVSVRLGHTSIAAAQRTIGILRDVSTAPILLVVNSVKQERAQYYEYTDRRSGTDGGRSLGRLLGRGSKRADDFERIG